VAKVKIVIFSRNFSLKRKCFHLIVFQNHWLFIFIYLFTVWSTDHPLGRRTRNRIRSPQRLRPQNLNRKMGHYCVRVRTLQSSIRRGSIPLVLKRNHIYLTFCLSKLYSIDKQCPSVWSLLNTRGFFYHVRSKGKIWSHELFWLGQMIDEIRVPRTLQSHGSTSWSIL
jgi:hypothetical protein